jgi:hypothetical protein
VSKLNIVFESAQKYTHYRFKLANNLEKISFDAVTLVYKTYTQEYTHFIESLSPNYTVAEEGKNTLIRIDGLHNLRLAEITIHTASMFRRYVYARSGRGKELYNLTFNDGSYDDTTIPFYGQIANGMDYELTIENGDDKPIDVKGITVKYYADDVIFEGTDSGGYALRFGADEAIAPPVYDIVKYRDDILKGEIDRLAIGAITPQNTQKNATYPFNLKIVFNIVVVLVAVLLGLLILKQLKKPQKDRPA